MIAELLVLASMLRLDPSGDAHGAGELIPPTAAVYSSLGPFDLVAVEVADAPSLVVRVRLAEIPDPGELRNGVTLPIVDVYLDTGEGGREELLAGPGMRMPPGRGWDIALRVHGDDAYAVLADDTEGVPRPLTVTREEDVLRLEAPIPAPEELREIHALTGVYDPFSADGWRPLASSASPWAFASEAEAPPVVDLLAEDDEAQRAALQAFTLPSSPRSDTPIGWLIAMVAGLGVAIIGLWLRRRIPAVASAPAVADAPRASGSDQDRSGAQALGPAHASASATARADRPGAERTLPTIWASSDGWWSEDGSREGTPEQPAGEPTDAPDGELMDDAADELTDAPADASSEEPHEATGEVSDDVLYELPEEAVRDEEEEASDRDRDGAPRPGAARGDEAS